MTMTINVKDHPWINIRVQGSDIQKLWRLRTETEGRTKFDWPAIRGIYEQLIKENPGMSQNDTIDEVQLEFQNRFSKDPPGRTSVQNHIKTWR